jgi:hypothetical protein
VKDKICDGNGLISAMRYGFRPASLKGIDGSNALQHLGKFVLSNLPNGALAPIFARWLFDGTHDVIDRF